MLLCFGKDCCASGKFLVFWKDCCVPESIVVFSKRLLCFEKDCCVLENIVVFWKRLLRCPKDCFVVPKIVVFQNRNWVVFCPYGPPYATTLCKECEIKSLTIQALRQLWITHSLLFPILLLPGNVFSQTVVAKYFVEFCELLTVKRARFTRFAKSSCLFFVGNYIQTSADDVIISQLQAISQLFSSYPPSGEFC